jgi:glycosyltransferase involved in cell wall biosynthesis
LPASGLGAPAGRPTGTILIVGPGGLENGGGIGRQMSYFLAARAAAGASDPDGLAYRLVETRGPWFLGASSHHIGSGAFLGAAPHRMLSAALRLGGAVLTLCAARVSTAPCALHVNIAGRGSTVRKLLVTAAARALALPYLLHVHDYDYAADYRRRGPLAQRLIRSMFRAASRVVVLGARDRAALGGLLGLAEAQVTVLHNAVPDPAAVPADDAPGRPCRVLFLGRLSERKGVPELLRALAGPRLAALDWHATLAGDGPIEAFRNMAAGLGIAGRVDFPGWVDQAAVARLCAEADMLVLPSHGEGLAMAVLEGLSYGLAVVATPVGAHAEVIEDGVSGLFVPPGDVDALEQAMARVVADDALRRALRAGARRRFVEGFDVRGYAERLGRIHAQMLTPRHDIGLVETRQAS